MIENGWIKIHRKMTESSFYFQEKFCRNMAWIDLLLLANHADNSFRCRGILVEVKRGQVGHSIDTFCKRWRWSKGKVLRFLNDLETVHQIVKQKNNVTTLISIVNYDTYQNNGTPNSTANDKTNSTANSKTNGTQTRMIKNDKNEKEEIQAPTLQEVKEYFLKNGYTEETACKAYEFYASANWHDSKGKPVIAWKQKMIGVWFKPENKIKEVKKPALANNEW